MAAKPPSMNRSEAARCGGTGHPRQGLFATTVDDVCPRGRLTKGSFFHHFESKQELALEAAAHFSSRADELFAPRPYQALPDPVDRLLGYVDFRQAILAQVARVHLPARPHVQGGLRHASADSRRCDAAITITPRHWKPTSRKRWSNAASMPVGPPQASRSTCKPSSRARSFLPRPSTERGRERLLDHLRRICSCCSIARAAKNVLMPRAQPIEPEARSPHSAAHSASKTRVNALMPPCGTSSTEE